MAQSHIRTVYAVKAIGEYLPVIQGVPYVLLEQRSGEPFFYRVVTVKGRTTVEQNVPVIPNLTIIDKASLAIDNLVTRIMSH
jgi:hypothetical protein